MLKKFYDWLDNLTTDYSEEKKDETLQLLFAVVLFHVIIADEIESDKEKALFKKYYNYCFKLDDDKIIELYNMAKTIELNFDLVLLDLNERLEGMAPVKFKLIKTLNELIIVDGIDEREYQMFERISKALYNTNQ